MQKHGQTKDERDKMNSRFSYCCEKADESWEQFLKAVSVGAGQSQRMSQILTNKFD
jgi:hypothetical protein